MTSDRYHMTAAEYRDAYLAAQPRRHKYGAREAYRCSDCGAEMTRGMLSCLVCGAARRIRFPSRAEARRWDHLRARERRGEIEGLTRQPAYPLTVRGREIGVYTADFAYREHGVLVVEDVKSRATMTESAKLRIKLAEAVHGISVRIVSEEGIRHPG